MTVYLHLHRQRTLHHSAVTVKKKKKKKKKSPALISVKIKRIPFWNLLTADHCRASSALLWQRGFAGPSEQDEGGFTVKIKQENLPGRNQAIILKCFSPSASCHQLALGKSCSQWPGSALQYAKCQETLGCPVKKMVFCPLIGLSADLLTFQTCQLSHAHPSCLCRTKRDPIL